MSAPRPLRVLFVEDSEDDAALELRELRKGGFDPSWERVDTESDLAEAMARGPWDLVISDHVMPLFGSAQAFRVVRERDADVPFLLVSGTIGEGPAVEAMRTGVQDYLLKGSLHRLAAVVDRELREAQSRRSRRAAEAGLREAEQRNRAFIENAVLGIYRADLEGRFEDANPALVRMLGHATKDELLARTARDVFAVPGTLESHYAAWFDAGSFRRVECRWRRTDGREITVLLSGRLVPGTGGGASRFEVFVEDVTEQKSLEAQFLQAQKLEALGQLASGVAHDFNNLLTVISGFTEVVRGDLAEGDPRRDDLAAVAHASDRSAALVRQLLAFSRRQAVEPRLLDLNELLSGFEKMLQRVVRADIVVETSRDPGLAGTVADPGQLEQVLMNLVVNARDAIRREGRIRIATRNVVLDAPVSRREGVVAAGAWVVLSVADTGSGMDEATLARAFEPFFTTKAPGKGTGLGLSTVLGIVRHAGGHVLVDSRPGEGTTFSVYLPRAADDAQAAGTDAGAPADLRGTETVLVAEDDDVVRRLLTDVLRGHGYQVLAAASGREAREIARRHEGGIDLLVTDLVMPGMSGVELAETLLEARPDLGVVLASGWSDDETETGRLNGNVTVLQKPFKPAHFAAKVREALDRNRSAARAGV